MRYITSTPWWLRAIFPAGLVWGQPDIAHYVYLTFDDGPHPEITPWVCDLLEAGGHKATFFCIGQNVERFPEVFKRVKTGGHTIGNHTYHHLNGFKTASAEYVENVKQANTLIGSTLFRPPYGAIKRKQAELIKQLGFSIVMWSGLSADFDVAISGKQVAAHSIRHCKPGNILVFHDSEKAFPRLKTALPELLNYMHAKSIYSKAIELG